MPTRANTGTAEREVPLPAGWDECEVSDQYGDRASYTGTCAICGDDHEFEGYYDRYETDEWNISQYGMSVQLGPRPYFDPDATTLDEAIGGDQLNHGISSPARKGMVCRDCSIYTSECGRACGHTMLNGAATPIVNASNGVSTSCCPGCVNRSIRRDMLTRCQCGHLVYISNNGRAPYRQWGDPCCPDCMRSSGVNYSDNEVLPFKDRTVSELVIGPEKQRPISRIMSFEMEMDGDYGNIMRDMRDAGWCDGVANSYHSSSMSQFPVHFENDASVAIEMIVPYLNMVSRSPSLHVVRETVKRVNKAVKAGEVQFTMRTGMHVHVDAHNFHPMQMRGLYLLWCYLEDVLFRISSVGYRCHRLGANNTYAGVVPKDRHNEIVTAPYMFGTMIKSMTGHSCGMNFGNYNQLDECRCGAVQMGAHDECRCSLGKNTIEFRVPNGTGNLTKVYTYLFLFQNMMNVAQYHPNAIKKLGKAQPFEYTTRPPIKEDRSKYKERITWMFENLCYNERERDALLQCVNRSDMDAVLTPAYIDTLRERECVLPEVADTTDYEALKKHRFPRLERA